MSGRQPLEPRNHRLAAQTIDLATLATLLFWVPWIGERIFDHSLTSQLILASGFLMIVAGVYAVRSLPGYAVKEGGSPSLFFLCLIFFQMVAYSLLYVYGTDVGGSEQENDGVAVIIFFVLLLPVIGSFSLPAARAAPFSRKALVVKMVALLSVDYLTVVGAAVWYRFSVLPTGKDPVYATGLSYVILFVLFYLLFLAFFGLPRIYLLRATGDRIGLAVYMAGLAVFLHDKIPPVS